MKDAELNNILRLNLPIIEKISVTIFDKGLFEFSKRQLIKYTINTDTCKHKNIYKSIISLNDSSLIEKIECFTKVNKQLSSNIIVNNKVFYIRKGSLFSKYCQKYYIQENKLHIQIEKYYKFNLDLFLKLNNKYSFYHQLFYDLILFPIFALYALQDNYYLLHGSLLEINNKTIVLSGLDSVGKSTLSLKLLEKGHNVFCDNFVLFNDTEAIGLNLPIRADIKLNTILIELYRNKNFKELINDENLKEKKKVDKIFILTISDSLKITRLNDNKASLYCSLINNYASEINSANLSGIPAHFCNLFKETKESKPIYPELYLLECPKNSLELAIDKIYNILE